MGTTRSNGERDVQEEVSEAQEVQGGAETKMVEMVQLEGRLSKRPKHQVRSRFHVNLLPDQHAVELQGRGNPSRAGEELPAPDGGGTVQTGARGAPGRLGLHLQWERVPDRLAVFQHEPDAAAEQVRGADLRGDGPGRPL